MKLEHQQHKLLQAHYENAIPVELLRKEQQRITHSLTAANHRIQTLEQDLGDKEELVVQALDIAQHMANTYHHAPNHIRRMLNQLLFEHVYLVPHDDTSQLTTTATCMPPFDSILGWGGSPTGSEQTLLEGEESMKPLTTDPGERDEEQAATPATAASDQPHTTTTRRSTDPADTTGPRGRRGS